MRIRIISLTMFLLFAAIPAFAVHPLVSDDAGTSGKGAIQIELYADISTDSETAAGVKTKTEGSQIATTFSYGITDTLDATFGIARPWGSIETGGLKSNDAGSIDYCFELKYQFYAQDGFSVAVKPILAYSSAVNSSDNVSSTSYGAAIVASKTLEPLSFHLNLGYSYNDYHLNDNGRNSIWSISGATAYCLNKSTTLVADIGTSSNADRAISEMPVFALLGAIYTLNKTFDFSVGGKVGLTNAETDFTGTFGLTFKF